MTSLPWIKQSKLTNSSYCIVYGLRATVRNRIILTRGTGKKNYLNCHTFISFSILLRSSYKQYSCSLLINLSLNIYLGRNIAGLHSKSIYYWKDVGVWRKSFLTNYLNLTGTNHILYMYNKNTKMLFNEIVSKFEQHDLHNSYIKDVIRSVKTNINVYVNISKYALSRINKFINNVYINNDAFTEYFNHKVDNRLER